MAYRAAHLAAGPTLTYQHIKTEVRSGFDNSMAEQILVDVKLQGDCSPTGDFKEGMIALSR